jgi:energy-coupling factor transport system ATP-binding protein
MGANGCGKSTLARLIAGLAEPSSGRIEQPTGPLTVGILFQNPDNQMVAVTVEKEIAFALENQAMSQARMEPEITDALSRLRIEHLRERLTAELSGGEKQRLALASVMVFRPPVLVLDEPDSFLDETGKRALREELTRIRAEDPSLIEIRITQYPVVADEYTRLIVLEEGQVVFDGPPAEMFDDQTRAVQLGIALDPRHTRGTVVLPAREDASPTTNGLVDTIEVEQLGFGFPGMPEIIKDLSMTVQRREILAVVGPSGAGKSCLGNLICGLFTPPRGSVRYLTNDGQQLSPESVRGQVSGLFQQPERQFFLPSCGEEIAFGPTNLGQPFGQQLSEAYFDLIGLAPGQFSDRDPITLSGGEKRRLAFAAVLSMGPRFVVFDEPTCGLDQEGVGRFLQLVEALKTAGVGMMLITHDGNLVEYLSDRVLHLVGDGSHCLLSTNEFVDDDKRRQVVSARTPGLTRPGK